MKLLIIVISIGLAIWVHSDAKKFRQKGIFVIPGLWSTLVFLGSIPLFIVYMLVRTLSLVPKAKMSTAQPLPPAAKWTNWLTLIILFGVVGAILISVVVASFLR
jgi:hypothetical protein